MEANREEPYVTVARIRRPQGRRGEVFAELLTDFPGRFHAGEMFWLWREGGERRSCRLEEFRLHKDGAALKFAGVGDITAAEELRGLQVQVPLDRRVPLTGGAVYISDLVGCKVREGGREIGKIVDVDERAGTPLLVVAPAGGEGELLIPFAAEICRHVDVSAGFVDVELPEGLKELNQGSGS